ncbi:MAG: hypothetical protein QOH08_1394 [Chloroflexota bacterium]|nr:hypothetical protein [Chloroflexota bacterium]
MTDPQPGGLSGRFPWWLGGLIAGALIGGLFASLGGIVLGLVFVIPFAAARGRAGAAIAGGLVGSGLAGIVVHGIAADINTAAAAITLAAGLLLTGVAMGRR